MSDTIGLASQTIAPILEPELIRRVGGKPFEPSSTYRVQYRTLEGLGEVTVPRDVLVNYERFRAAVSAQEGREVRDAYYDDVPSDWPSDLGGAIEEGRRTKTPT